jgi:hypothetical protein
MDHITFGKMSWKDRLGVDIKEWIKNTWQCPEWLLEGRDITLV